MKINYIKIESLEISVMNSSFRDLKLEVEHLVFSFSNEVLNMVLFLSHMKLAKIALFSMQSDILGIGLVGFWLKAGVIILIRCRKVPLGIVVRKKIGEGGEA